MPDESEPNAGAAEEEFLDALMDRSTWIAGYPPWYAESFLAKCGAKSRDDGLRLLHARRAIEEANVGDFKRLLAEGMDPNARLPRDDGSFLQLALCRHPNPEICEALLDAGADVNAPGLVYAACSPGFESVRTRLLAAGADPNNHPGQQSPVVSVAAGWEPRATTTLKLMLDVGMSVDGTATVWPDNKTDVRNCTGLMMAAWRGKPAIVKLLLSRGADVNRTDSRGNTALDWARNGTSKNHVKVIELLEEAGAPHGAGADLGTVDIPDFRKAAKTSSFKEALASLQLLTGAAPEKVEFEEGVVKGASAFVVDEEVGRAIVANHQQAFLSRGVYIFLSREVTRRNGACVVALPTTDVYQAIAAIQTNGINSDVTTADLIRWLKNLEKDQPFELSEIGPDMIRGRFTTEIQDPSTLLNQINRLCPDGDPVRDYTAREAQQWADERKLFLWWD